MCVKQTQNSREGMPEVSFPALEELSTQALTHPSTLRLCISPEHPPVIAAYLLDHLADCLPKGLFQSTP